MAVGTQKVTQEAYSKLLDAQLRVQRAAKDAAAAAKATQAGSQVPQETPTGAQ